MITAIFIPSMGRPDKLKRVVENIHANTTQPHKIYFVIEEGDIPTIEAVKALDETFLINEKEACYAGAINTAYEKTTEPFFFTGADDLDFHPLWLEKALECMSPPTGVVGTNDLGNIPIGDQRDATHYLISRIYIKENSGVVDRPNTVLFPYLHNYTDKEFIETAQNRGAYKYQPESEVEHLHWAWNKNTMDDTYRRGLNTNSVDQNTFQERRHLWQS